MNRYYTATIPVALAEKLKEKGMPIEMEGSNIWCPSYAEVLDWFASKGICIFIEPYRGEQSNSFLPFINNIGLDDCDTWHDAANQAIIKATELI